MLLCNGQFFPQVLQGWVTARLGTEISQSPAPPRRLPLPCCPGLALEPNPTSNTILNVCFKEAILVLSQLIQSDTRSSHCAPNTSWASFLLMLITILRGRYYCFPRMLKPVPYSAVSQAFGWHLTLGWEEGECGSEATLWVPASAPSPSQAQVQGHWGSPESRGCSWWLVSVGSRPSDRHS